MQAELMNYPVNYKDPDQGRDMKRSRAIMLARQ
jgi:hypothetical protein